MDSGNAELLAKHSRAEKNKRISTMIAAQSISTVAAIPDAALSYGATNVVPMSPNKADINTHAVWITRFEDETAQAMSKGEYSLPVWRDHILATTALSKEKTPWLKLATFGDKRSAKGSLRTNDNLIEITGVECDYDDEKISFDAAVEVMRGARVRCLLYTSASHSPEKPRWRVLAPLSKNYPPTSRASMVGRLNGLFGGALAPESFVLSTSYHYGSVNSNPHHRAVVLDGQFLDLMDRLHAGSIDKNGHRVGHKDFEQKRSPAGKPGEASNEFLDHRRYPADKDKIVAALAVIDPDCGWVPWYKIGCAIRFELGDEGEEVFHNFSARSKKYNKAQCGKKWSETKDNTYHRGGTISYLATLADPNWRDAKASEQHAQDVHVGDDGTEAAQEHRAPTFSEESLALIFANRHERNLRYVAKWGSWMQWDGARWAFDETMCAFSLSRAICREAASVCKRPNTARAIATAKTVAAVERLAKADRVLAATVDQWDAAPLKFNEGD
jgi:Primase C terminal 2 (PriCT-2)/D5 N terminal like